MKELIDQLIKEYEQSYNMIYHIFVEDKNVTKEDLDKAKVANRYIKDFIINLKILKTKAMGENCKMNTEKQTLINAINALSDAIGVLDVAGSEEEKQVAIDKLLELIGKL
jgi:hypothetical protein